MRGKRVALATAVALLLVTAGCLGGIASENGEQSDNGANGNDTGDRENGDGTNDGDDTGEMENDDGTGGGDDAGEGETDTADADALLQAAIDARETVDTVQGTRTAAVTSGGQTFTTIERVWIRPPDSHRAEVVESNRSGAAGDLRVRNGTRLWIYFEQQNRAVTTDLEESSPVSGSVPGSASALQAVIGQSDVNATHNGTATVAGRDVHVIEFTTSGQMATYDSGTVWIDRETNYPLKQELRLSSGPAAFVTEFAFEEVTLGEPIDDDRFAFEPPADAELREFDEMTSEEYESVDAAESAAPFDLPDPDLPEGYALDSAIAGENFRGWTATLQYRNGEETFITITVSEAATNSLPYGDSESVEIGGVTATITDLGENISQIEWEKEGLAYAVNANEKLTRETLISIAESIVE